MEYLRRLNIEREIKRASKRRMIERACLDDGIQVRSRGWRTGHSVSGRLEGA